MKTKHSVLTSTMVIIAAISVTTIGAYAYLNAKKSISTNKFSAGTLDLDVKSGDSINQPITIDNVGANGKIGGSRTWIVRNTGTIEGKLIFGLQNISNLDNGCNEPEIEAEPNCQIDNFGELGKVIVVKALIDGQEIATTTLENNRDFVNDKVILLKPNEEIKMILNWEENPNGYGNEVQSDTVSFDMVFRLDQ